MANSMYTIEMDFANARRQAEELEQIARHLDTLINSEYMSCFHGIAASWRGENADAFCKKGTAVGEHILRSATDLKNAAQTIRKIAENTYHAEKRILEIAQTRNY